MPRRRSHRLAALLSTLALSATIFSIPRAEAATQPSVPSTVQVTKNDPTRSARISWAPPAAAGGSPVTGYRVSRSGTDSRGAGPWSTFLPATARSQVFTFLRPGDTYALTVQAINAVGTSPTAGSTLAMAASVPGPPTVTVSQASWNKVSWTAPTFTGGSAITGYRVSRNGTDLNGVGPTSVVVPASASSYFFENLRFGAKYTFSVAAINTIGTGESSSGVVYQVPAPPGSMDLVVTQHPARRSATVAWPAPDNRGDPITAYYVNWGNVDPSDPSATDHGYLVLSGQTRAFTLGPLTPGATYEVDVVAENGNDAGGGGRTTFTVPTAPTVVQNLTLTAAAAARTVTATWSPPAATGGTPITRYRIVTTGNGSAGRFTRETFVSAAARSATIRTDPNTPYEFSVQAVNAIGPGPGAKVDTTTGSVPPGRPRHVVTAKDGAAQLATLFWEAPVSDGGSPITGYRITRDGTDANGGGAQSFTVDRAVRSQSFTDLKAGTTYTVTIQTINAAGASVQVTRRISAAS